MGNFDHNLANSKGSEQANTGTRQSTIPSTSIKRSETALLDRQCFQQGIPSIQVIVDRDSCGKVIRQFVPAPVQSER